MQPPMLALRFIVISLSRLSYTRSCGFTDISVNKVSGGHKNEKIRIALALILRDGGRSLHHEKSKTMDQTTPDVPSEPAPDYVALAADIVSAYVSNNPVRPSDLSELLTSVHAAISSLAAGGSAAAAKDEVEKPTAAQIKKSITPDALISFEDGKPYKTLRRHLNLRGLSPEAYRTKYGLSPDYPMTAASYSAQRSELARSLGLGNSRKGVTKAKAAASDETVSEASAEAKPKKAGRPRKAPTAE
jgi:predicted transcriptional regulator